MADQRQRSNVRGAGSPRGRFILGAFVVLVLLFLTSPITAQAQEPTATAEQPAAAGGNDGFPWATVITAAGIGAAGLLGGGGLVTAYQVWRQGKRERWKDIRESYEKQIELAEKDGDADDAKRLRSEYAQQLEAWRAQQEVVKLAPTRIDATEARPSLPEEQVEELKRLLAQSRLLSPALLSAQDHFLRGNAYYEAGEHEKALSEYQRSLELRPDDPDTLSNRGVALDKLRRHKEALADYNRSLELLPDDAVTLASRGAALTNLGRNEEALADCTRSLELQPDDPDTLTNRGGALYGLGRSEEALADFTRSLKLLPDDPGTLNNRGTALGSLGRADEALADYNRSLELRPDQPVTLNNRGVTQRRLGLYDDALRDFDRSLGLRPDEPDVLSNRALVHGLNGDPEGALRQFDRALGLGTGEGRVYYVRAKLPALQNEADQAIEDLRRAVASDATLRSKARTDPDFDNIRDDPRFRELVGPDDLEQEKEPPPQAAGGAE